MTTLDMIIINHLEDAKPYPRAIVVVGKAKGMLAPEPTVMRATAFICWMMDSFHNNKTRPLFISDLNVILPYSWYLPISSVINQQTTNSNIRKTEVKITIAAQYIIGE